MSMIVNGNPNAISWEALLNQVNQTNGAESTGGVSETNRAVTFTMEVNGTSVPVTVNIPTDLALPSEVTPGSIDSLMEKLAGTDFNLSDAQLAAIKDDIQQVYKQMAGALHATVTTSTGSTMFDLYQLMALLVEVAQSQRNASRDLRAAQNQQIQNSIQAQADIQRTAALVGLVVGVVCGAASALMSIGMLAGQAKSFKSQVNVARSSGVEAMQNKVSMTQSADTAQHAQAQLTKVESQVSRSTANTVKSEIRAQTADVRSRIEAQVPPDSPEAKALQTAKNDLATTKADLSRAETEAKTARTELGIADGVSAEKAKANYLAECKKTNVTPDQEKLSKYDVAVSKESSVKVLQNEVKVKEQAVLDAEGPAFEKAIEAKPELRAEYRKALNDAADDYTQKYADVCARQPPATSSEISTARNEMRMARAYANNEIAKNPALRSTAAEHKAEVAEAKAAADTVARTLDNNMDYRAALRRVDTFASLNGVNTSIGNMLQSMVQSITGMINAEATRMSADQKAAEEQLDQTKDLFSQAQTLVDAAVQLMNAVRQAETQSMRDAIQA